MILSLRDSIVKKVLRRALLEGFLLENYCDADPFNSKGRIPRAVRPSDDGDALVVCRGAHDFLLTQNYCDADPIDPIGLLYAGYSFGSCKMYH